jgi:hypothetical protein
MNPINYTDPDGEFKRIGNWAQGSARLRVQRGDNADMLASLIPGANTIDVMAAVPSFVNGSEINISSLINKFENKVRGNISSFAKKATKFYGLKFSTNLTKPANLGVLKETQIRNLFNSSGQQEGYQSGCFIASSIIVARGIIETLKPGEYDAIYPFQYENIVKGSKKSLGDLKAGDRIHFYNKVDSSHAMLQSHGVNAEWVLGMGGDNYYGFGYPGGESTGSSQEWLDRLASTYNSYTGKNIGSKDVRGYYGHYITLDYFKLAQAVFDRRNGKK